MKFRKPLLTIAVAAALAGCGGGSETIQAASPAATANALRAQAQALRNAAVTPEEAARQLMDAAESAPAYAGYFPSRQQTQYAGPFAYRYYPETGVYLGVVVVAGTSYEVGAIYVIGGPFGGSIEAPVPQGVVTNYITPVAPAPTPTTPPPSGTANGCFDTALLDTEGTRFTVSYAYSGDLTGTQTVASVVGGVTSFQGYQARETVTTTTSSMQGGYTITAKVYTGRNGDVVTQYGMTTEESAMAPAMRTYYTPPYEDRMAVLALGESQSVTQNTTYTYLVNGSESSSSYTSSYTTTYLGVEPVRVAAGTYEACKFEVTSGPGSPASTNWYIRGKGLHVKSVTGNLVMEATAVRLNDQPI